MSLSCAVGLLSCAIGLLPPLFASAKGVKRERKGLCSSMKRERQSKCFVLKDFLFSIYDGCKSFTIIIGATKLKNQNYVPNIIYIYILNCDFSCETKIMYQIEFFFLQS